MGRKKAEVELVLPGVPAPTLEIVDVDAIALGAINPRTDGASELDGLTASIGQEQEPYLTTPPSVMPLGGGRYEVLVGERRVRGVRERGWRQLACQVYAEVDALAAHELRLRENLHRKDLHPLDEAIAFKLGWLNGNAVVMGLHAEAAALMSSGRAPRACVTELLALLTERGFSRNRPQLTQRAYVARHGLDYSPDTLKRLLQLMTLDEEAHDLALQAKLSDASLRAVARLETPDQVGLLQAIVDDTEGWLGRKARAIARSVKQQKIPLERAISIYRGEIEEAPAHGHGHGAPAQSANGDAELAPDGTLSEEAPVRTDANGHDPADGPAQTAPETSAPATIELRGEEVRLFGDLLTNAEQVIVAIEGLGDLSGLPEPWGTIAGGLLTIVQAWSSNPSTPPPAKAVALLRAVEQLLPMTTGISQVLRGRPTTALPAPWDEIAGESLAVLSEMTTVLTS
jgi:ParB-like chromosome segregation protein Spo0J